MKQVLLKSLLTSHSIGQSRSHGQAHRGWDGDVLPDSSSDGAVQSHMAKDVDADAVVGVMKSWKE